MNELTTVVGNLLLSFFLLPFLLGFYKIKKSSLLEIVLFSFAVSVGGGTLVIFYLMIFFPGFLIKELILLLFSLISLSTLVWRFDKVKVLLRYLRAKYNLRYFKACLRDWETILWLLLIIFFAYILIDSLFKPLFEWDTLARYAYWGHRMYILKQVDAVEVQYPLLIPLTLTYSFLLSGAYNDYLAKIIPALFSISTILVTYLLGKQLFGKTAGLLGAFILANTPVFYIWAARVYIDIPQAFYTVIFIYSLYRYLEKPQNFYLVCSGLFLTFSLWTKQTSVAIFCSVVLLLILSLINRKWQLTSRIINLKIGAGLTLIMLPLILTGFWYVRNYVVSGEVILRTYSEADRSVLSFFPFLSDPESFNHYLVPLYFLGLLYGMIRTFQFASRILNTRVIYLALICIVLTILNVVGHTILSKPLGLLSRYIAMITSLLTLFFLMTRNKKISIFLDWKLLILAVFMIPYSLLVWWNYSVEPRYWTPVLPFWAVLGSASLVALIGSRLAKVEIKLLVVALSIVVFIPLSYKFLEHEFFLYPTVSDFYKKSVFVGDAYQAFRQIAGLNLPTNSIILSHDVRLGAFAPRQIIANEQPITLKKVRSYDYFLVSPITIYAYNEHESLDNEVLNNLNNDRYFDKIFELENGKFAFYKIKK